MFKSTKTYGNDRGLSCCFRQYMATSHCHLIHGYSLGFKFVFVGEQLDKQNWVVDFGKGGFGEIKDWLHHMFDHTLLIAKDDPEIETLKMLGEKGLADIRIVEGTGCELTAKMVFDYCNALIATSTGGRCWIESVEVFEHGSNSAIYCNPDKTILWDTHGKPYVSKQFSVGDIGMIKYLTGNASEAH